MERGQIVAGATVGVIAVFLWIYVSFTARGKGPILSNSYIFASKEERDKINVKAEYRLVTIIFSGLALIFSLLTLYIITEIKWLYILTVAVIVFIVIYSIWETIKSETKKK